MNENDVLNEIKEICKNIIDCVDDLTEKHITFETECDDYTKISLSAHQIEYLINYLKIRAKNDQSS